MHSWYHLRFHIWNFRIYNIPAYGICQPVF
nr:MAG TPA: hypothetical protein [Caudoviricetes sp.]